MTHVILSYTGGTLYNADAFCYVSVSTMQYDRLSQQQLSFLFATTT